LRDKVVKVLVELGARKDLKVYEAPCSGLGGVPTAFPGVTVKMSVLEPAPGKQAIQDVQTVPAHWKRIELLRDEAGLASSGDCELVEQIKQTILPLFAARNVDFSSSCIPHQLNPSGARLRADVLVTDQKDSEKGPEKGPENG
jgi:hypothetical protein